MRIRDEQPGSYFLELRNPFLVFLVLKYQNSLMRIRDGDSSSPGWKKVGSGIRNKHPGSATLEITDTILKKPTVGCRLLHLGEEEPLLAPLDLVAQVVQHALAKPIHMKNGIM
jgi:hypothetical protein